MNNFFDTPVNRRGSNCVKWDCDEMGKGVIPMWVADMDFKAAPAIINALHRRVDHGVFGYNIVPTEYYDAVINWFRRRHNWIIKREWIQYTTGVVPAISAIIKAVTHPFDKVIVFTPVYNCFFSSIRNNECEVIHCPLKQVGDTYTPDFLLFETLIREQRPKVFLLCNPHNPVGRVWTANELSRMADICLAYGVTIIADEIHCELVMPGNKYRPMATINQQGQPTIISCISASKSFNIAGLQIANIVCNDQKLRALIDRAINDNEICDVNPFGIVATIAAYNESEQWLNELNQYIWQNYLTLRRFFNVNLPHLKVTRLEGTYLAWVDISATGHNADEITHQLRHEVGVLVSSGSIYSAGQAEGMNYIRINLACPRTQLDEALNRIYTLLDPNPEPITSFNIYGHRPPR